VNLTETGESRVNGYLFVLERSLKTFLPMEVVRDAVREIESHLNDRIEASDGSPNERDALEHILLELGPPLHVARAYSAERIVDEAIATERIVPMLRAVWHLAVTTVIGFAAALGILIGYLFGVAFLSLAILKPVFPNNVGVWVRTGHESVRTEFPWRLGAQFPIPANEHILGGYWVIPICLFLGLLVLVANHRASVTFLRWWRSRRAPSDDSHLSSVR
jgi:HAAS domain-containing protein